MSKISSIYDLVTAQLRQAERYRDDDNLLVASIWWHELTKMGLNGYNLSTFDFMTLYQQQKLTSADTITRARRKIQEENPELRGKSYRVRHVSAEKVKKDLRNL